MPFAVPAVEGVLKLWASQFGPEKVPERVPPLRGMALRDDRAVKH